MEALNSLYSGIKHTHMLLISVSVLLFLIRFGLHMFKPSMMDNKFFKIAPHIVDTFLLLSGLLLCVIIKQYPFVEPWLTEKIFAVFAYVLLAYMALKSDRNKLFKIFAFLGAIGWVVYAAKLAIFKQAVLIG